MGRQPVVANAVASQAFRREVVFAIDFDDQPMRMHRKIGNVWSNRRLPTDMDAVLPAELAQFSPKPPLTIRHRAAKAP